MRGAAQLLLFSSVLALIVLACGSRTGLIVDIEAEIAPPDAEAGVDVTVDVTPDRPPDGPLIEGGPLDVQVDCPTPAYCDPQDKSKVWKCGVPVFQCSSLETCQETGEDGARCVNPCVDTLGQDTSNGCEFYAAEMDVTDEVAGVCFAVFVVTQWETGEPARIEVTRGNQVLPVQQFARIPIGNGPSLVYAPFNAAAGLAKDQIAILFLSRDPAAENDPDRIAPRRLAGCPPGVVPAVVGDAALHGTGRGQAFRIKTNVPVVAYQMLPYGAGRARVTGATLLLPTNVWDTNYVAVNAYPAPTLFSEPRAGPTMMILGKEDNTQVTINPTRLIQAGGGLPSASPNVPTTYTVNRGEYIQFTQPQELTGSAILATQPVAVIGGSTLMDVPLDRFRADSAEQMLPPVKALASEYVAVRYRSRDRAREESVPWRIVGVANGTQLTYEPPQPGAPSLVQARQVVEFSAPGPFIVRSQDTSHPFYFASYMTGGQPYDGEGDPEFVNVISPQQYLPRYTFFTDPTYPETNLVVVRAKDTASGTYPDVTLDCAGTLGGWQPIGTSDRFQFTRRDLSSGNFVGQGGCDNGVHTITATLASPNARPQIGVTIWGWGNPITYPPTNDEAHPRFTRWVSYGYPAGANIARLNDVVLPVR
jgi:hypothetical protein